MWGNFGFGESPGGYCPWLTFVESSRRALVVKLSLLSSNWHVTLPRLTVFEIFAAVKWPKFREEEDRYVVYHHAKFHDDRYHCRCDICNQAEKNSKLRTMPYWSKQVFCLLQCWRWTCWQVCGALERTLVGRSCISPTQCRWVLRLCAKSATVIAPRNVVRRVSTRRTSSA